MFDKGRDEPLFVYLQQIRKTGMAKKNTTISTHKTKKKTQTADLVISKGFWKKNALPAILLLLLPFVFYLRTLNYEFVLDDQIVLTDNSYTKKGISGIWDILTTESMQGYFGEQKNLVAGARYRPLSIVTFALEHELWGLNSSFSHFNNILLYSLLGLLLFRVLSIIIPVGSNPAFFSLSFLATFLFVLHPLHVEVVANIKGRDEILSMLGSFGALYFALRYVASNKIPVLFLGAASFYLALLSKENAVTFLAVIPLTLLFFTKASWKKISAISIVFGAVFILYMIQRFRIIGYLLGADAEITDLMNNPFYGASPAEKLATIFYTLGLYLKLLFFPHPLTHDYYPHHIPIMNWGNWKSLLSLALYIALAALAIKGWRRKTIPAYAILFYLITLSIVSNIVFPIGTFMNDRFVFVSSLGATIGLAWLIVSYLPQKIQNNSSLFQIGLLSLFSVFFAYKSWTRVPVWENPITLNSAAVKVSKNSARANCMMGTALFEKYKITSDPAEKYTLLEESAAYINKAVQLMPSYSSAQTMRAGVAAELYKKDGNLDQLLAVFYEVLTIKKRLVFIDEFLEYLKNRADTATLSQFAFQLGYEYFFNEMGDYPFAYQYLKYGTEVEPNNAKMTYWLGKSYEKLGYANEAMQYINRARQLDPNVGK